jgi:uncharacterized protein YkwD
MRRAVPTLMLITALVSGCGGGSDRTGGRPTSPSGSQGPAAAVTPEATDGRLGGAVVARPGKTLVRGHVEKITGRSILPPSNKHGVAAEDSCPDVDVQPTPDNLAHVSDVIFCLMNAMRADAGLAPLRQQDELAKASVGHSQDMVDNKYFAHDTQDGHDVVFRLKQVGYIPTTGDWVVGENLAWGSGSLATPKALVNAWMNSPPHRENLLANDYLEVGMGVVYGTPSSDAPDGVTVTTDFGTRPAALKAASSTTAAGTALSATTGSGTTTAVARAKAAALRRKATRRRRRALHRCAHKHGKARRRCVRAARKIH